MGQDATAQDARKAVLDMAHTHYAKSNEPLYVASVGQNLRTQSLWPREDERRSLKDWLKTLEPDIYVVQDEEKPARVAISTPDKVDTVRKIIFDLRHTEVINSVARPVLLSFCVKGNEGSPVYVTRRPPFRYTLFEPTDKENYHVVPPELRIPGLRLSATAKMQPSDVGKLGANIQRWADTYKISLESLSREFTDAQEDSPAQVTIGTMSALDRLIAAQRHDIRSQLVVPADIAALLSRHK